MNFVPPGLGPSIAKGFSSRKAYTRDLNFWASSARSFAIRVWGKRFATSIVKVAQSLLLVSTSKVGFEKFAWDARRFRRIRASLISRHLSLCNSCVSYCICDARTCITSSKKLAPRALTGPKSTSYPNLPLEAIYANRTITSRQSSIS